MSQKSCVFCMIIDGRVSSARVHEDEYFIAIRDIQPQARVHLLLIPRQHLDCMDSEGSEEANSRLLSFAVEVAGRTGLAANGYRVVVNTREWGGQTVSHLHMHLLGGEPLRGSFA